MVDSDTPPCFMHTQPTAIPWTVTKPAVIEFLSSVSAAKTRSSVHDNLQRLSRFTLAMHLQTQTPRPRQISHDSLAQLPVGHGRAVRAPRGLVDSNGNVRPCALRQSQ
ncbi:hypothetical protein PC116_g26973 [Phytophthora cactorum]|nr:hypothetical protein PC119_g9278 [Phytophthora cactorum]KAG4224573.1 hypothetical protein PC116_g26973 [Phytophthora cactorum]